MLNFENVALRRGNRVLFSGASFTIHPHWKVGITGANGCGKSSLLALLRGELGADSGDVTIPADLVIAHAVQETPLTDMPAIEYVLDGDAELRAIERALAASEDGVEQARLHARLDLIDGYTVRHRAARLLHGLGFTAADAQQPVRAFSGGWRVRLNLAQALMTRSDLLLLDEPTNHLDLDATLWLEDWLTRYPGTLLVISHDRDFLDGIVDHVLNIDQGCARLAEGDFSTFERRRAEELAQQQALYQRQQRDIAHMRAFVERFRAQATKARQAQSRLKALARMELIAPAHVDSPFRFDFPPPQRMPHPLVRLRGAAAGYGERVVLHDVDVGLDPGDRVALLGRNGAGKSTLVKLLAGELEPRAGEMLRAPDLRVGYFAQHQLEQLRAGDGALAHLARLDPRAPEQRLRDFIGGFGFPGDAAHAPAGRLSGGEKARLVLAMLVYQAPQLLLLDEPTNHLDLDMRHALTVALQDFTGAVVVVSHDRYLLRTVSDDLWLVADGRVGPFAGDLDDYRDWLLAPVATTRATGDARPHGASARQQRRRRDAEARQRLTPLKRDLAAVERELARLGQEATHIEHALADADVYTSDARARLRDLHQRQAGIRAAVDAAESRWLELSDALETARGAAELTDD
ncbi:MAG: ATP-binding cassette domain-containing protein [Gammaproteobacteria bacterium]|nr:ATP-binding cassette domain-containing protein [Gammaproteobacteria bacterium]